MAPSTIGGNHLIIWGALENEGLLIMLPNSAGEWDSCKQIYIVHGELFVSNCSVRINIIYVPLGA
jgi:hypothetical protein